MPVKSSFSRLIILIPILLLLSCASKKSDLIIDQLQNNLITSNNLINRSTFEHLKALTDKTTDWATKEKAEVWLPKAQLIKNESDKIYSHIEELKRTNDKSDSSYTSLYKELINYSRTIFNLDSRFREVFPNSFDFINRVFALSGCDTLASIKSIDKKSSKTFVSILGLLQNELKITENKTIVFCNSMVTNTIFVFDVFEPLVGQNATVFSPDETITIMAGIGAFSKQVKPEIWFGQTKKSIGDEGFVKFQKRVSSNAGKYSIPVKIKYTNWVTGKEDYKTLSIKYSVIKCDN